MIKKLTVNLPEGKWSERLAGVYRMTFNNGRFYIGSSSHLRQRSSTWKSFVEKGIVDHFHTGKMISRALDEVTEGCFDVLEYVQDTSVLKDIESKYLTANCNNPLFINDSYATRKPIIVYDLEGNEVNRFISIYAAASNYHTTIGRIQDVLTTIRRSHMGLVFMYEDESLNVKSKREIEIHENKTALRKNILILLSEGCTMKDIAKEVGIHRRTVDATIIRMRRLNKAKTNTQLVSKFLKNEYVD